MKVKRRITNVQETHTVEEDEIDMRDSNPVVNILKMKNMQAVILVRTNYRIRFWL